MSSRRSAGGAHIHPWRGQPIPVSHYCQEWIEGDACSALFAGRQNGSAIFLGATRQLLGLAWLNADGFRYCGNVGPLVLATTTQACLVRLGDVLRTHQVLRSISGDKTTKLGTGRFWVIDVEYHNQRDELVGVESYTGFGYRRDER